MKQAEGETDNIVYLNRLAKQLVITLYFYISTYFLFSHL